MEYLIAAYTVIWLVTFLYVLSIGSRQHRLAAEVERLQAELELGER